MYWIPLFGVLEERGFQVMLVIRGASRTCLVARTCWTASGCRLHTYGWPSTRSYLRPGHAGAVCVPSYPAQKALTQMNVKLHHVISNITGKTGMEIMEAIVGGQRDPVWRNCATPGSRPTRQPSPSRQGHWREEHIFELTQALELYRFYQDKCRVRPGD